MSGRYLGNHRQSEEEGEEDDRASEDDGRPFATQDLREFVRERAQYALDNGELQP